MYLNMLIACIALYTLHPVTWNNCSLITVVCLAVLYKSREIRNYIP